MSFIVNIQCVITVGTLRLLVVSKVSIWNMLVITTKALWHLAMIYFLPRKLCHIWSNKLRLCRYKSFTGDTEAQ